MRLSISSISLARSSSAQILSVISSSFVAAPAAFSVTCSSDLLERHQLRAARGQRGQHGAERAALFARGGDEQLQLVGLLLDRLSLPPVMLLEGV